MESVFAAFPRILEQFENDPDAREAFVFAAWRRTVGDALNEHSVALRLADERLYVGVANLMWLRHLETIAAEILAKLNKTLGRPTVKFIEFVIDENAVAENRATRSRPAKIEEGTPAKVYDDVVSRLGEASAIRDDDLRNAFLLAAASCLERKDRMKAGE